MGPRDHPQPAPPTSNDPEPRAGLTRRRAVGAGAAVGAAALLAPVVQPFEALAANAGGASQRLVVARDDLVPGRTTGPIRAPRRFDLLGASLDAVRGIGLEVRARPRGGAFSPWIPLSDHDGHAPDGRRATATDPVWFGHSDEIELRVRRRPAREVRLLLVAVSDAEKRRGARATTRAMANGGVRVPGHATSRAAGTHAGLRVAPQPTIIPRSAWAQGVRTRGKPLAGTVRLAFVHHTVNANDYGPRDSAGIVRAIAEYHIQGNGWNDIGYNFVADRYGQIFEGRAGGIDRAIVGAQAIGWNSVSTGIAIVGTFSSVPAPDAALNAVAALIRWKLGIHGVPTAGAVGLVSSGGAGNRYPAGRSVTLNRISGHRDGCSTDCPGNALYRQLPVLRGRVGGSSTPVSSLTLDLPSDPPAYGATLALSGRLTTAGAGVGGVGVVVEKVSPSGRWTVMGEAVTAKDGSWGAEISWRREAPVRARAGDVRSPERKAGIVPTLELDQPTRHVHAGHTFRVRGKVRGVDAVQVELRRKTSRGYRRSVLETLKVRHGRVSGRVPVRARGLARVTLRVRSGGKTTVTSARHMRGV